MPPIAIIGGLSAALSLLRAGLDVHVYEQARELSEVGAGVQVSPNASRILHGLGLAEDLAVAGVRPLVWHQRRWDDGRTLVRAPLGDAVAGATDWSFKAVAWIYEHDAAAPHQSAPKVDTPGWVTPAGARSRSGSPVPPRPR